MCVIVCPRSEYKAAYWLIIRDCLLHNIRAADTALLACIISHCFRTKCFICMGQAAKPRRNECLLIHPRGRFHFPGAVFRTAVKLTPSTGIKITGHSCAKAIKPKEKAAINHGTNHRKYSWPTPSPGFASIPIFEALSWFKTVESD